MVHLFKDPKGETALDTSTGDAGTTLSFRRTSTQSAKNTDAEMAVLKRRITELEDKLTEVKFVAVSNLYSLHCTFPSFSHPLLNFSLVPPSLQAKVDEEDKIADQD